MKAARQRDRVAPGHAQLHHGVERLVGPEHHDQRLDAAVLAQRARRRAASVSDPARVDAQRRAGANVLDELVDEIVLGRLDGGGERRGRPRQRVAQVPAEHRESVDDRGRAGRDAPAPRSQ